MRKGIIGDIFTILLVLSIPASIIYLLAVKTEFAWYWIGLTTIGIIILVALIGVILWLSFGLAVIFVFGIWPVAFTFALATCLVWNIVELGGGTPCPKFDNLMNYGYVFSAVFWVWYCIRQNLIDRAERRKKLLAKMKRFEQQSN